MGMKFVAAGFRHNHIFGLLKCVEDTSGCELTACCETHTETRESLNAKSEFNIQYDDFDKMLNDVECDAVIVGDHFSIRGNLIIKALKAGKHVIADKPLCTNLSELDEVEKLAAGKKLKVGCMLNLREYPALVKTRQLIQDGILGEINAVSFNGQHPLFLGSRPEWYFEDGKHGGTINDIAIHCIDYLTWATGMSFTEVIAARTWNASVPEFPAFKDGGQFMAKMENGCGVIADVSYFAPDGCGYKLPYYCEFTIWGKKGVVRSAISDKAIKLSLNDDGVTSELELPEKVQDGYFVQFLNDVTGRPGDLNTATVIEATRTALKIQEAADKKLAYVEL